MLSDRIEFEGQTALVTGAGRGLGAAYARLLASRGAQVMVHDAGVDPNGNGADRTLADGVVNSIIKQGGVAAASYELLGERTVCHQLVEGVIKTFGRLDILIHNAGIVLFENMEQVNEAQFQTMMNVHVNAPFWLVQAAMPVMRTQNYGRIVLTTSGRALYVSGAVPGLTLYGIGKMAQVGLMNAMAAELEGTDIHINAISPVAATRMLRRAVEPGTHTPEQVAPGVAYLASNQCSTSGIILRADNGHFSIVSPHISEEFVLSNTNLTPEAVGRDLEGLLTTIQTSD